MFITSHVYHSFLMKMIKILAILGADSKDL